MSCACTKRPVLGIDASRALSDAPTGIESYAKHLIEALLPRLVTWHVKLYFRQRPPTPFSQKVEQVIIPFPRLWTHVRLGWELRHFPPDVLFVPAHVLPLHTPCRSVVTVHDLGFREFPQAHPWKQRLYLEWSTKHNVRTATHILADSKVTRQAICATYGVSPEKITVAYPGHERELSPVREPWKLTSVRAKYHIPGDYILSLGRIQPRKNLVRLVEAFALLKDRYPHLSLVLAGPAGWLAEPIHKRVHSLGLGSRVNFPGYIAKEDKAALISGARVFAYPSLYEGFGFPALEAQACGVPLLASNTSSLPEVIGRGGVLVSPFDVAEIATGLRRLLDDDALRRQVIAAGYDNLKTFSWEATADTVASVLQNLRQNGDTH